MELRARVLPQTPYLFTVWMSQFGTSTNRTILETAHTIMTSQVLALLELKILCVTGCCYLPSLRVRIGKHLVEVSSCHLVFLRSLLMSMMPERRLHKTRDTMTTTVISTKAIVTTTLTATVTTVMRNSDGAAGSLTAIEEKDLLTQRKSCSQTFHLGEGGALFGADFFFP